MIIISIIILFSTGAVLAQNNDDAERNQRLKLIEASQNLAQEKQNFSLSKHKIGAVFTNFGEGDNVINSGIRVAPQIASPGGKGLNLIGDFFYLRGDDELATFVSLSYQLHPNIYLGAGGALSDIAEYQLFVGANFRENYFFELRAINTGESVEDSEIYPAAGFQISF
jgi:hypothetical protein